MRLRLPRLKLRLRTMIFLILVLAVMFRAGLTLWSPTRRLGRLLGPDQPVYVRREAASALGHEIPFWEKDRALSMLIDVLDDPSPRVREYATAGLWQLGASAEPAIPKVIHLLKDDDRFVRSAAARLLGTIAATSPRQSEVVTALDQALADTDPDVRLSAAHSLLKLSETEKAASVLIAAYFSNEPYFSARAAQMIRTARRPQPLVPLLAAELLAKDGRTRKLALKALRQVAPSEGVKSVLESLQAADDPEIRRWAAVQIERTRPK